jgi:hypothetical protein
VEAERLYALAAEQGVIDHSSTRTAPSLSARLAYGYLQAHYTSDGLINYQISTYDNNVCHLRYLFLAGADSAFDIRYDIDAADIRLDTVKSIPPRQSGERGIGFAGIDLDAVPGRRFKAAGHIKSGKLKPTSTAIRLLSTFEPDEAIVRALIRLAAECGGKPVPVAP